MTLEQLIEDLKGKTIDHILQDVKHDCGLIITFTDNTILHYYYSSCEGSTIYKPSNSDEIHSINELG